MKSNKFVLTVPCSTNGYPHLNNMKFYDYFNNKVQVIAKSNSSITFTFANGETISATCSAPAYSNSYLAYEALFESNAFGDWWCGPSRVSDWTLTFAKKLELGFDILKISWYDPQTAPSGSNYTIKFYDDTTLLKTILVPVINSGGSINFNNYLKMIVYKDGKYLYRKA